MDARQTEKILVERSYHQPDDGLQREQGNLRQPAEAQNRLFDVYFVSELVTVYRGDRRSTVQNRLS